MTVAQRLEEVRRLTTRAHGAELAARIPSRDSPALLADRLPAVRAALVEELRHREELDAEARLLVEAALAVQDLATASQQDVVDQRSQLDLDVERALAELRAIRASNELLDRACSQLVRHCGFQRAMLSRVEGETWLPWQARFHEDLAGETSFLEWMAGRRIPLADAPLERSVLEDRRPAMVADATTDPRTYKPLVDASITGSYVVAPIIPAGRVVGFLHADHGPATGSVDEIDRYALWAFAEGFGRLYERAVLMERLTAQRDQIRETFDVADEITSSLTASELELVRDPADRSEAEDGRFGGGGWPEGNADIDAMLTDREREVLQMMVKGHANAAIAERLVIREGTVKSHVKHILRKLGAVNRAEAIARYLGAGGS
jgi:DNA-binding CsgD family transcriptional regulator